MVDKFSDVLVVESLAMGIDRLKSVVLDALVKVLAEDGITIRGIYERSDAKVRLKEGMEPSKGFIGAEFDTKVEIVENGGALYRGCTGRSEDRIFPGSEKKRAAIHRLCKGSRRLRVTARSICGA